MSNGNGHRWSKFWWCDWQNDKGLQQCSLAARGLWIELLGLCHASEKPGYLLINGEPPDNEALADVLGRTTTKEIAKLLDELERRRIFSREDGVIFSRRMVKDTAVSEQASKWGKRGGNPALNPQGGLTPPLNPKQGNGVNPTPYPPPLNQKLEAEEEAESPPRSPPASRGGRAARPHRNGFVELERRLKAAENAATIDGTSSEIVDFLEFTGARPKAIGGTNG